MKKNVFCKTAMITIKGTVRVISCDPPCQKRDRFITVSFKPLTGHGGYIRPYVISETVFKLS